MADLAGLQAPHLPLMRAALAAASPRGARVALDLACGPGGKTAWLAGLCAPGALVAGLDLDRGALAAARSALPGFAWLAGDALALPLRPASAGLIWCVAALGLFADPGRALGEAAEALAPGGALVVATAGERWVRRREWAPGAVEAPRAATPPADDLGADLAEALRTAGLGQVSLAAYLLDPPGLAPRAALLPLADLGPAAPLAVGEPEPLPVLLVAAGRARA
ncbi:MAG TPA: methyltransferase domain-containing protein [Chloroflexaceae bacterium]|nr:methyltransferase domain-containing protein [Chloroflexaceae bacterium]